MTTTKARVRLLTVARAPLSPCANRRVQRRQASARPSPPRDMEGTTGHRGADLSRRQFPAGAGVAVATPGPLAEPAQADDGGRLVPRSRIRIQLYTVRDLLAPDPVGTLRQIAAIGHRNIELAGLAGLTAVQFRALATRAGSTSSAPT
jgi:hypothetical protein